MKIKYISLTLLFFFTCFSYLFSQEQKEIDNTITKRVSDIFNFNNPTSNFLIQQQLITDITSNVSSQNNFNSSVFIRQIGSNNEIVTASNSINSNFEFNQNGNDNSIRSINTGDNVNEFVFQQGDSNNFTNDNTISNANTRVLQNGNSNSFLNFSFGNVNETTLDITQNGNNLTFEKFGTNALTNSLQFVQEGNARNITVRSF